MRKFLRFLPFASLPVLLAALAITLAQIHEPIGPALLQKGYQSFVGVLMLLMQF